VTSTSAPLQSNLRSDISRLIQSLKEYILVGGACPIERIRDFEKMFNVSLPKDYQEFLSLYGAISGNQFSIFGFGNEKTGILLSDLILLLRLQYITFSLNFVPIEDLGQGEMACLDCSETGSKSSAVYRVPISKNIGFENTEIISSSFWDYLHTRLTKLKREIEQIETGLAILEQRVKEFQSASNYNHAEGGKLPRNHVWRPYRFCVQDVLLGATVVQHVKGDNFLNVDVFMTEEVPPYEPDSGVKGLTLFLLCEAYKCGGTMEIRFTENVEGGRIPRKIQELAERLQLPIPEKSLSDRRLTPRDSRTLFAALTPFSPEAFARISELNLSIERACYVVQKGIWSLQEAETILLSAVNPDRLFSGGAPTEQRLLYGQDILYGRTTILGGYLDRALSSPQHDLIDSNLEVEDDERSLDIHWLPSASAKIYKCAPAPSETSDHLQIPWTVQGSTVPSQFAFGQQFAVIVRARDGVDICQSIKRDIQLAYELGQKLNQPVFILLPYDFYDPDIFEDKVRLEIIAIANKNGIGLLVCPETSLSLDTQVQLRFNSSRIIRE